MRTFEIGKNYTMKSPCDQDCKWTFTVVGRTAKSIKLKDRTGTIITKKVKIFMESETCQPLGNYSMSPILSA